MLNQRNYGIYEGRLAQDPVFFVTAGGGENVILKVGCRRNFTSAGAPFHVSPISVPEANVGEIPGFSTRTIPEDGLMHPIIYWNPEFEKLTDMDLAKHIIQAYIDGMREEIRAFSDILTHDYLLGHVLPRVLSRDSNEVLLQELIIPYALLPDTDLLATFYMVYRKKSSVEKRLSTKAKAPIMPGRPAFLP